MRITEEQLQQIMPNCRYPQDWVRPLNQAMDKFDIARNIKRISMFLGQVAHESNQLNTVQENLNYGPRRVMAVWPSRFKTIAEATACARNPEKLANLVYGNRLGNGPPDTGDGFRFRGRGLLQVTGRENYCRMSEALDIPGLVDQPDRLLEPRNAALSAAAFWHSHGLNEEADKFTGNNMKTVVTKITKKINGGKHGLEQRLELSNNALDLLDTEFMF